MWTSKYFTFDEVTHSQLALRQGIGNELPAELDSSVFETALKMDVVRERLRFPVLVDSWYRCPKLNKVVGGAKNSAHMTGFAIDFRSPQFGEPYEVFKEIKDSGIKYDQLILEFNRWVHISFAHTMRQDNLIYDGKSYRRV